MPTLSRFGALMSGPRIFVTCYDTPRAGRLLEHRRTDTAWVWVDHGTPAPGVEVRSAPCGPLGDDSLVIIATDGMLWEHRRVPGEEMWSWTPIPLLDAAGTPVALADHDPGAALPPFDAADAHTNTRGAIPPVDHGWRFFVVAEDGYLWRLERQADGGWLSQRLNTPDPRADQTGDKGPYRASSAPVGFHVRDTDSGGMYSSVMFLGPAGAATKLYRWSDNPWQRGTEPTVGDGTSHRWHTMSAPAATAGAPLVAAVRGSHHVLYVTAAGKVAIWVGDAARQSGADREHTPAAPALSPLLPAATEADDHTFFVDATGALRGLYTSPDGTDPTWTSGWEGQGPVRVDGGLGTMVEETSGLTLLLVADGDHVWGLSRIG